ILARGLRRNSIGSLALFGVLLGLAALTRSILWLFPPILGVFLLFAWKGSFGHRLLAVAVPVAPFALTIAPWAYRCTRLEKTFVAIDTMGGRNFMTGNYQYPPLFRSWDAIALEGEKSWYHEVFAAYPPSEWDTQGKRDKLALRQGLK